MSVMNGFLKKYRLVIMPLVLVLVFDFALLIANYFISNQLEVAAVNINISGRQRMLSQKLAKTLVAIHYNVETKNPIDELLTELNHAADLFDKTLVAFIAGGRTVTTEGKGIILDQQAEFASQVLLSKAKAIWQPLLQDIHSLSISDIYGHIKFHTVIDHVMKSNLQLLNLMNSLTNQLEKEAKRKTYLLRGLQTLIAIMVLLSFMMAVLRLYRRESYYNNLMEKSTDVVLGVVVRSACVTFMSSSVYELVGYDDTHYLGSPAALLFTQKSQPLYCLRS